MNPGVIKYEHSPSTNGVTVHWNRKIEKQLSQLVKPYMGTFRALEAIPLTVDEESTEEFLCAE